MPEERIDVIAACGLSAVGHLHAPVLAPAEVRPLPRRDPRLFALDLVDEDGAASEVNRAVAAALAGAGLLEPERRPFWPHLTLARVRGRRRARGSQGREGRVASLDLPAPPVARLACPAVTLYRSHLSSQGARYEPLARRELGARY